MADVSKLSLDGVTYEVKDAFARDSKMRIYKSFADLGTDATALTIYEILELMEPSSVFQGSFTTAQITNLRGNGDIFIFKSASMNVIQKSIIILNTAIRTAADIGMCIGYIRAYDNTIQWYSPTLTKLNVT